MLIDKPFAWTQRNLKPIITYKLMAGLGDLDTPRASYEVLVANDPYDPITRIALGRLYPMTESYDLALRELGVAVRLDPHSYIVSPESLTSAFRERNVFAP